MTTTLGRPRPPARPGPQPAPLSGEGDVDEAPVGPDASPGRWRRRGDAAGNGPRLRRPPMAAAVVRGAWAVLSILGLIGIATFLAWFVAAPSDAGITQPLRAAGNLWLIALGAPLRVPDGQVSLWPLGLAVLVVARLAASARGLRREARPRTRGQAVWLAVAFAGGAAAVAALGAGLAATPAMGVAPVAAAWAAFGPALVTAGVVLLPDLLTTRPGPVAAMLAAAARGAGAALGVLVAAGALVTGAFLVLRHDVVGEMLRLLQPDFVGGLVLLLGSVLLLPTLIAWNTLAVLGAGYSVGVGTGIGPGGAAIGALPLIPALAGLPPASPPSLFWTLLPAVAVAAGAVGARLALRGLPAATDGWGRAIRVGVGLLAAVIAALGMGLLAFVTAGDGPGRLAGLGGDPVRTVFEGLGALGAGAFAVALVDLVRSLFAARRARRSAAFAAAGEAADVASASAGPDDESLGQSSDRAAGSADAGDVAAGSRAAGGDGQTPTAAGSGAAAGEATPAGSAGADAGEAAAGPDGTGWWAVPVAATPVPSRLDGKNGDRRGWRLRRGRRGDAAGVVPPDAGAPAADEAARLADEAAVANAPDGVAANGAVIGAVDSAAEAAPGTPAVDKPDAGVGAAGDVPGEVPAAARLVADPAEPGAAVASPAASGSAGAGSADVAPSPGRADGPGSTSASAATDAAASAAGAAAAAEPAPRVAPATGPKVAPTLDLPPASPRRGISLGRRAAGGDAPAAEDAAGAGRVARRLADVVVASLIERPEPAKPAPASTPRAAVRPVPAAGPDPDVADLARGRGGAEPEQTT